ncbi:MAG: site-specific DNA-methyltransferase [Rickettsiales bacterium]|nr:site-specific DNA-methyltransferase [Rickettsiales bacterium]
MSPTLLGGGSLEEKLFSLLKTNKDFINNKNELLIDKILSKENQANLIELLLTNEEIKTEFFTNINNILVFKQDEFTFYLKKKNYLNSSYTKFDNKIGFNCYKELNNNVVLNFPYKDCILEGGQNREEDKRQEIFFNEILAKKEIKRLFEPKVLTNFKKYNQDGETQVEKFNRNADGVITDNLLIKGNNLIALHSLVEEFRGKVKLIYIDPPYNTGNDGFKYNDSFNHSTWLCFMKNRLEIARELLREDGSIYVQMDVKEAHYLKVLMDEIFGRNNFRSEIIWDTSIPYVAGNKWLSNNWIYSHSVIFYYAFNINVHRDVFNKLTFQVKQTSGDISNKPFKDIWTDIENFAGFLGVRDIKINFNSRKPEKLIERIIKSSTNKNDIVLDFFAGSGTTGAVAHKMNRQWIMIEQMDYIEDITKERLKKVVGKKVKQDGNLLENIEFDNSGISKSVNWQGGGEFIYCELKKYNEDFVDMLKLAETKEEVINIFYEICKKGFVKYNIDIEELQKDIEKGEDSEFLKRTVDEMKQNIYDILNKNMLYIPMSIMNDNKFNINEEEKRLSGDFYGFKY